MEFTVERNDITKMAVDAIVCPSNPKLREGSGTSAAIFGRAGRISLANACASKLDAGLLVRPDKLFKHFGREKGVPVGCSVVTSAYALPSKIIIHSVVPKWAGGGHGEYNKLCEAYVSALAVADRTGCETLAIPLLAAGNMGFDLEVAAEVAINSIESFEPTNTLRDVTIVTYSSRASQKMRDHGFMVKEVIDERYVQENDERYKPLVVHAAGDVVDAIKAAAPAFANKAIAIADDIIGDSNFQKAVKKVALAAMVKLANDALKQ